MTTSEQAALLAKHYEIYDHDSPKAALYVGSCDECYQTFPCDVHRMAELKDAEIAELKAEIERLKQLIGKSASMGRGILTILGQAKGTGE